MVQTAKAVVLASLLDRPEYVRDGRLATELTRMFVRYTAKQP